MADERSDDSAVPARGGSEPVTPPAGGGTVSTELPVGEVGVDDRPYVRGMAAGLGSVLLAGLVLALVDVVHSGGGGGALPPLFGLWSLIALPIGIGAGVVLGAGNAQWGTGWVRRAFRRLREDDDLDRVAAAVLVSGALVGGVLVLVVSKLAMVLVASAHRANVGALLLGIVVVAALPVLALGGLPTYRVVRRVVGVVPAVGPLSRVVLLVVAAAALGILAAVYVVFTKLDYQAMNLGGLVAPALLPVLAIGIGLLAYGPLSGVRKRVPAAGLLVAIGAAVAAVVVAVGLRSPSPAVQTAVMQRSYVGPMMIAKLRALRDADHDGFSAFFGGPDCDDHNPAVNPNATEIPGNGIDDNCLNGDGKIATPAPPPDPNAPLDAQPPKQTLSGGKNVVILFVDTLRFDRLGLTGYTRDGKSLTPRMDALAKQSTLFTRAYSQAPNTPRSVPSFLASRYPSQLKMDDATVNYPVLGADNDFLFESLQSAGFKTIGMTSHFFFCDRVRSPSSCAGVKASMNSNVWQGADEWDNEGAKTISESNHDIAGPRIVEKTIARLNALGKSGEKFAMFVHLFEPHSTYMDHPELGFPVAIERGDEALKHKYDYEIAAEDQFIGQILDALDSAELTKDTTIVLLSDHGEAFGVHRFGGERQYFHGSTLYDELIHVPLLFKVPGAQPREVKDVVELVDLAPTIAALFGVKAPASWQGHNLVPYLEGASLPPAPAFSEMQSVGEWKHDAKSMVTADGTHHLFYSLSDSVWELYDLTTDPEERKNVMASDPRAATIKQQIGDWVEGPLAAGGGR